MALSKLSEDQHRTIFSTLCNVLEPRAAVDFSSVSPELWALTQALRQQLRADHEARKVLMQSSKELRKARQIWISKGPLRPFAWGSHETDLATLISLVSVLPALEVLHLEQNVGRTSRFDRRRAAGPDDLRRLMTGLGAGALPALTYLNIHTHVGDAGASALAAALGRGALQRLGTLCLRNATNGVQRLIAGLGAGALPALTSLYLWATHVGDAGASALAAALGRGALLRLTHLTLNSCGIGDPGLVAFAPALRRLPSLESIDLAYNPLGDEGLAALVAPPPLAGALSLTIQLLTKLKLLTKARVLTKLEVLDLSFTQITDAGCAALASALYSGTLPALKTINLEGIPASAASKAAVIDALEKWRGYRFPISQGIQRFCALHDIRCFEDGSVALWLYGSVQVFATLAHGYAEFVHSASVDVLTLSFVLTLSLRLVAAATCSALLTTYLYERGYFHRVEYFLYCVVSGVN